MLRQLEAARALGAGTSLGSDALIARSVERLRGALGEVAALVASEQSAPHRRPSPTLQVGGQRGMLGQSLGYWVGLLAGAGVSVHLSIAGDIALLPDAVEIAVAELLGEAFANVAAHSAAAEVNVSLLLGADTATVTVADPGPARRSGAGSGSGLARHAERVADLGGRLTAGACPDGGFVLRAQLPVQTTTSNR